MIFFLFFTIVVIAGAIIIWPVKKRFDRLYNAYMTIRDKDSGRVSHKWVKVRAENKRKARKLCKSLGITLEK